MNKVPPRWRKSSASAPEADCVELVNTLDAVRDSKNPTVILAAPGQAVRDLLRMVRA